jgi:hypothetical protein
MMIIERRQPFITHIAPALRDARFPLHHRLATSPSLARIYAWSVPFAHRGYGAAAIRAQPRIALNMHA